MSDTIQPDRAMADSKRVIVKADQTSGAQKLDAAPNTKRKLLLSLLAATVVVSAVAYGTYYYTDARFYESTDDAYVSGNLVQLTPQVSGTVVAVNADDTQIVKAGDPGGAV
jgi:membrane fusion protein (multidrug efflux system)